nr:hypothetical protein [Tanacetum cinerariifolium]
MVKMVSHKAFACSCAEGDVVLRQLYKPESCGPSTPPSFSSGPSTPPSFSSGPSTPSSYSSGPSTPPSFSSGPSTPSSYSSGPSTPPNNSSGSLKNAKCLNCKQLCGKISERKPRKGQNRIKTGQKREAWRSQKKFKAVAVDKGRKTEENAKRMVENAYTVKKLFKL